MNDITMTTAKIAVIFGELNDEKRQELKAKMKMT